MKKLISVCVLSFSFYALGFTGEDLSSANYIADQNIITKQTDAYSYRLDEKILRQEVIGMALKLKGITLPENYTCKKYFADATKNDWVCRAVELAADNGIITRSNTNANPTKNITRAEALAIMMKAGNGDPDGGYAGYSYYFDANLFTDGGIGYKDAYKFGAPWQASLFYEYIRNVLRNDTLLKQNPRANDAATRSEVFGFVKNITSAGLPKIPEFGTGWIDILPGQLSCVKTEIEVGLGDPLCSSDDYKKNAATYTLFLSALRTKDNPKIAQYGAALGAYNYGFSETKYRVSGDSFFGMTFGPQAWGSVLFPVYTVRNNTIVRQVFTTSDADYKAWEKAIIDKYNLKSLDEIFANDTIKTDSAKYTEILNFANQYWYDRFEKMEIK